jgi:hypothetical protein
MQFPDTTRVAVARKLGIRLWILLLQGSNSREVRLNRSHSDGTSERDAVSGMAFLVTITFASWNRIGA